VVMFGEPGAWVPSGDILRNTIAGLETFVRLGDEIALAPRSVGVDHHLSEPFTNDVL
jgi:hypothetical protein